MRLDIPQNCPPERNSDLRRGNRLLACLLVGILVPLSGEAASYEWVAGTDSWDVAANWAPALVPVAGDEALIANGGNATIGMGVDAALSNLRLGGSPAGSSGGVILNGGNLTTSEAYLGSAANATGVAILNSGKWSNATNLYVGYGGAGALTIGGGNLTSGVTSVGHLAGSNGTLSLEGGQLRTGQVVGGAGASSLVFDGGTLQATGNQSVFIGGLSRGVTANAGGAIIDTQGFSVTATSPISGSGNLTKLGSGTLSLTGTNTYSGGTRILDGTLQIGDGGTGGTLAAGNVTNDATLAINRSDAVTISNQISGLGHFIQRGPGTTTLTGSNTYTGATTAQGGTLRISGGSVSATASVWVENAATLAISDGGRLTETYGSILGSITTSGNNTALVTGAGSAWTSSKNINIGYFGGNNTLTISDGGRVDDYWGLIGNAVNSRNNSVLVTGAGSAWINSGIFFAGGYSSNNTLTISNGGRVTNTVGHFGYGQKATNNTALVTGAGSLWTNSDTLYVGEGAAGNSLTISDGGKVEATNEVVIASQSGSGGTLNIGALGGSDSAGTLSTPAIRFGQGVGVIQFNQSNVVALTANISGAGSLKQLGSGATTLSGANTYSGGTTVNAGTLVARSQGALGTGAVTLNGGTLHPVGRLDVSSLAWNGGTVAISLGTATDFLKISGNLTGGGAFDFSAGAGFASNTYYPILSAANLDDSFLGSFSGNPLFGLPVRFSRSGTDLLAYFQGAYSGPLLQNIGGPAIPTTANFTVGGAVRTGAPADNNTINSLTFEPASSLSVFNTLTVTSGLFGVAGGAATVAGGTVAVPGSFSKTGGGALFANSGFVIGGPAAITAGALYVNGRFAVPGGLTVFPNALLGGGGTIAGSLVNRGTVNPGNSPGTLTVLGDYTQVAGATLAIEIASPTLFDRLVVGGTAHLGGVLQILNAGSAPEYGRRYAFLQAGSISGAFDTITTWDPATYRARLLQNGGTGTILIAPASYTLVALTQNQKNVARALDSYIPAKSGDRLAVSTALDLQSAEQYPQAFDQISPGFYDTLTQITIGQAFAQTQMINQRLSSLRLGARGFQAIGLDEQPLKNDKDGKSVADPKSGKAIINVPDSLNWSAWAMGTGIFARASNLSGIPNYHYEAGGFLAGADYTFGGNDPSSGRPTLTAGLYGGYNYTYAKYTNGGSTQINSALFGLYGTYSHGGFYADTVVGGGYNGYSARRSIKFSTVDRTATSRPYGGQFNAALNFGYDWKARGFTFGPIGGLQYTYAGVAPFTEQGASSLDLRVNQQNVNSMIMTVGGRMAYNWNISQNISLIPEARLFWQHEFLDNSRSIGASLDGGAGPSFDYQTDIPDRDSVFAGAGLAAQLGEKWNAFFYYNTDFGRQDFLSHAISAGLGLRF